MDSLWSSVRPFAPVLVALVLVLSPIVWPISRHVVTFVHEAGHAVAAVVTGRQLLGIRLHSDTSGLTLSRGKPRGPGMVLTVAAGYLASSVVALASGYLSTAGEGRLLGLGAVALVVAMAFFVRNAFGVVMILLLAGALWLGVHFGTATQLSLAASVLIWFLLLGNIRTIVEVARRRSGRSDIDQLRALTHVPRALWIVVLGAVAIGCAVATWRVQGLPS